MQIPLGLKKVAALVVLKNGNQFLLLKRAKEPNKDTYTPVGGKLDPFETPLNAAIRETWEETGIKVDQMKFCGVLTESAPSGYNWISYVYLAEIDFVPPPPCNEGDLAWIHFDHLLEVPTPKTDWFIYKYLLDGKPFAFCATFDAKTDLIVMNEEIEGLTVFQRAD